MAEEAEVSVLANGDKVTIVARGVLNFHNSDDFSRSLAEACSANSEVVVDLLAVEFIDSKIVQDLGRAAYAMLGRGKKLKLIADGTAYPRRVLKISDYDTIIDIQEQGAPR